MNVKDLSRVMIGGVVDEWIRIRLDDKVNDKGKGRLVCTIGTWWWLSWGCWLRLEADALVWVNACSPVVVPLLPTYGCGQDRVGVGKGRGRQQNG